MKKAWLIHLLLIGWPVFFRNSSTMYVKKTRENKANGVVVHTFLFVFNYSDVKRNDTPLLGGPFYIPFREQIVETIRERVNPSLMNLKIEWTFFDKERKSTTLSGVKGPLTLQVRLFDAAMRRFLGEQYEPTDVPVIYRNLMRFGIYVRVAVPALGVTAVLWAYDFEPLPSADYFAEKFRAVHVTKRNRQLKEQLGF